MSKICKPEYLTKVQRLTKIETERLFSRMEGKLPKRLEKDKLSKEEALALQLELEDEQLEEWRKMMRKLNEKEKVKEDKADSGSKSSAKSATPVKTKAAEAAPQKSTGKVKAGKKK